MYMCVHEQAPYRKRSKTVQTDSKKAIGTCAFQVAVPELWNKLPAKVRISTSLKTQLKTHSSIDYYECK